MSWDGFDRIGDGVTCYGKHPVCILGFSVAQHGRTVYFTLNLAGDLLLRAPL